VARPVLETHVDLTTVLQEIQSWRVEDRLELLFRLWDQIVEDGWQPELTDELKAELDRRLASYKANPENVLPWPPDVKG
jgi:putative addiction module component (TIGR02574 family)